jgi:Arylsulfotransferase (ASST)
MGTKFTRRRFLMAAGAGATYLALTNTVGCEPAERTSKTKPRMTSRPAQPTGEVTYGPQSAAQHGVWSFRSRPDLSPPAVEVAKNDHEELAPGYVFVAPQSDDNGQGGSLIIDSQGQVVWFRPLLKPKVRAMNFGVQTYQGKPVLTWKEAPGPYVIFDDSYREIARFKAANGYGGDHHEFLITPQDTALITIYNAVPQDLSSVGGSKDGVAVQGIFQELDVESGKVLFEWHSLEHVGIDESYGKPGEDIDYPGIDYFHINSIDVDHDDNLLVSARKTSAIYKIDRKTGEIIWRLGGKKSDFEMGPGVRFAYQHDARRLPDGTISLFDNGTTVFSNGYPKAIEESRAIILELDERNMKASLLHEYTDGQYADAAGNSQVLPDGNVFIGWGRALEISEFSHDGKLLFDARLQPGNRSYKAYRFPWSARPSYGLAAAAERTSEGEVTLYASWNGGTEVTSWEVLAGPRSDGLEPVGSAPRIGFETTMVVRTSSRYVAARAKDSSGDVLGATEPIDTHRRL